MTSLQKLFTTVPAISTSSFLSKYYSSDVEGWVRNTDYDEKIVFLEGTNEIFTHGKLYGLNNSADVTALETLVGDLPTDEEGNPLYTSIVDYIDKSKEAAISGITIGSNKSLTVAGTVYTLHVNNGEITLDPYTALSVNAVSQQDVDGNALANSTVEFDVAVTKSLKKIVYKFAGTDNCKYLSIKVDSNWVVGTGSTIDKMESVDLKPGQNFTKELDDAVEISTSTGSANIDVWVYAKDETQTTVQSKECKILIAHNRAYLVGNVQPTADTFTTYSVRTVGGKPTSIDIPADATKYGWFAYPASWGTPTMKDKDTGLGMTMAENDEWNLSDIYSDKITYKVYRTGQLCGKKQTIVLTW